MTPKDWKAYLDALEKDVKANTHDQWTPYEIQAGELGVLVARIRELEQDVDLALEGARDNVYDNGQRTNAYRLLARYGDEEAKKELRNDPRQWVRPPLKSLEERAAEEAAKSAGRELLKSLKASD